jgi:Domain of unknown function (DUF4157)
LAAVFGLRVERRQGYTLVIGRAAPGAHATTLGHLVFVRPDAASDDHLLRHELAHVAQWQRLGIAGFLRRYLGAYLRWRRWGYPHVGAYRRIPLEVEAEWEARLTDGGGRVAGTVGRDVLTPC